MEDDDGANLVVELLNKYQGDLEVEKNASFLLKNLSKTNSNSPALAQAVVPLTRAMVNSEGFGPLLQNVTELIDNIYGPCCLPLLPTTTFAALEK